MNEGLCMQLFGLVIVNVSVRMGPDLGVLTILTVLLFNVWQWGTYIVCGTYGNNVDSV